MKTARLAAMFACAGLGGAAVAGDGGGGGGGFEFTLIAETPLGDPCGFVELHEGALNDLGGVAFIATVPAGPDTVDGLFLRPPSESCIPVATSQNGFLITAGPSINDSNKISFTALSDDVDLGIFLFDGVNPLPQLIIDASDDGLDSLGWSEISNDDVVYYTRACLGSPGCGALEFCISAAGEPDVECSSTCLLGAPAAAGSYLTYLRACTDVRQILLDDGTVNDVALEVNAANGVVSVPSVNSFGTVAVFVDAEPDGMPAGIYTVLEGARPMQGVDLTGAVLPLPDTRPVISAFDDVAFEATGPDGDGVFSAGSPNARILGDGDQLFGSTVIDGSVELLDGNEVGQLLMRADLDDGTTVLVRADPTQSECAADVNGDEQVDVQDLTAVIIAWGPCRGCPEDIDGDGNVGTPDLTLVILGWGDCDGR